LGTIACKIAVSSAFQPEFAEFAARFRFSLSTPSAMTSQLHKKGEAWSARFNEPMSDLVKRYTSSVFFDKRLAFVDIDGSLAHAAMLAAQKIIGNDDLLSIQRGMTQIRGEIERGEFEWKLDLEDVHLNIEARLTALIGDAGKRLHTGRSRNDQVATDIRLWLRGEIDRIGELLVELRRALIDIAEQNAETIMPGFTHLQVAQPVTFGHHLLAYDKDNQEDKEPLFDTVDTVADTLRIFAEMAAGITVKPDAMRAAALQGFSTATDLADYLVKRGLPFRDAHEAVALAVRICVDRGCDLADLSLDEMRAELPNVAQLIGEDVFEYLTLEGSVASRNHAGGTAPEQVRAAVVAARAALGE
jgi:argininosuccinate lyase